MPRHQYGRGNVLCPECGNKTGHDGFDVTFGLPGTTFEAQATVTHCSKCGANFIEDTKVVTPGRGKPLTHEHWVNRLQALNATRAQEQRLIESHMRATENLDKFLDALLTFVSEAPKSP
jgi:predicted nucleic-acid-binding Zn-ribbon protein